MDELYCALRPVGLQVLYEVNYNTYTREGYTFEGWNTAPDGSGTAYADGCNVFNWSTGATVTIYAQWAAQSTVTLDMQSGTGGSAGITATAGRAMPDVTPPARTGYTFGGYYTAANGGGTQYYAANGKSARNWDLTGNQTLYAKWTENSYPLYRQNPDGTENLLNSMKYSTTFNIACDMGYEPTFKYASEWTLLVNGADTGKTVSNGTYTSIMSLVLDPDNGAKLLLVPKNVKEGYDITFFANNGTDKSKAVHIDNYAQQLAVPSKTPGSIDATWTKEGYTFDSWRALYDDYDLSSSVNLIAAFGESPKKAMAINGTRESFVFRLYALWNANTYTVAYDANGGSGTMASSSHTYDTASVLTPGGFTREGWAFLGWNTDKTAADAGTVQFANGASVQNLTAVNNGSVTLYAVWKQQTGQVFFNYNGGSGTPESRSFTVGEAYGTLPEPNARTGYTFGGWFAEPALSTTVTAETLAPATADTHTLYAKWTAKEYTVVINTDGGTLNAESSPFNGGKATFGQSYAFGDFAATKSGYDFLGWTGITGDGVFSTTPWQWTWDGTGSYTFTAKWTPSRYSASFDQQYEGAAELENVSLTYASKYPQLPAPGRRGYTFGGWYATSACDGAQVTEETTVTDTERHTLYAKWTANTYTVSFNQKYEGAAALEDISIAFGESYKNLPQPTRLGYAFGGWFTDEACEVAAATCLSAADHTLYAKWNAIGYTVRFSANGGSGTMDNQSISYDTATALTANTLTRVGYAFAGWNTAADGSGTAYVDGQVVNNLLDSAGSVDLFAQWKAGSYVISFDPNGGVMPGNAEPTVHTLSESEDFKEAPTADADEIENGAILVTFDATYGALPVPTRPGYDFAGWEVDGEVISEDSTVKVTANSTAQATWNAKKVMVSFDSAGGTEYEPIEQTYDSAYVLPVTPVRQGYSFVSWTHTELDGEGNEINADVGSDTLFTRETAETLTARWAVNYDDFKFWVTTAEDSVGMGYESFDAAIAAANSSQGSNIVISLHKDAMFGGTELNVAKTVTIRSAGDVAKYTISREIGDKTSKLQIAGGTAPSSAVLFGNRITFSFLLIKICTQLLMGYRKSGAGYFPAPDAVALI